MPAFGNSSAQLWLGGAQVLAMHLGAARVYTLPLPAVTNFGQSQAPNATCDSNFSVYWNVPTQFNASTDDYELQLAVSNTDNYSAATHTKQTVNGVVTAVITDLTPDTAYDVRVRWRYLSVYASPWMYITAGTATASGVYIPGIYDSCSDCTLMGALTDGCNDYYTDVVETNSVSCGYLPMGTLVDTFCAYDSNYGDCVLYGVYSNGYCTLTETASEYIDIIEAPSACSCSS